MARRKKDNVYDLSPSEYHRQIVPETVPSLRYDGGDLRRWQQRLRRKLLSLIGHTAIERPTLDTRSIFRRKHPPRNN